MTRDDCTGCPIAERRDFLRRASLLGASLLLSLGAVGAPARALAVGVGRALRVSGRTVAYALPESDGATIDRDNEVILVRWEGAVYAFALSCPHQNTALKWREEDGRFQCPKHKSKYRPDGEFISGRATRGMDRFAIALRDREVVVDLDVLHRQDEDRAGWDAALVRL